MDFLYYSMRGLIGLAALIGIAWLFSTNRKAINWRLVGIGLGLQIVFALLVIKTSPGYALFSAIGSGFAQLLGYTNAGIGFLLNSFSSGQIEAPLMNFAFTVLPIIIFFAALMGLLYHIGAIQPLVKGMGWFMAKTMGLSGAESLSTAANVFIGQTEAPLVIRPYIEGLTKSEMMTLMVGGMATIAGSVLAAYISMLGGDSLEAQALFATHLVSASLMSAPAAIVMAKILVPETQVPSTTGQVKVHVEKTSSNVLEATANGASDGLRLAANVGGMLLAFLALIAMFNAILAWVGAPMIGGQTLYNINDWVAQATSGQFETLSLEAILGFIFAPLAWCMGVESADILQFGRLMGEKLILTEFIAYSSLAGIEETVNPRTVIMGTYALCGFANLGSIAIQIGGIGGLAPSRKGEIAELGFRAVIGGALASWMTATIAGVLVA